VPGIERPLLKKLAVDEEGLDEVGLLELLHRCPIPIKPPTVVDGTAAVTAAAVLRLPVAAIWKWIFLIGTRRVRCSPGAGPAKRHSPETPAATRN
jgi:hypothetical protein